MIANAAYYLKKGVEGLFTSSSAWGCANGIPGSIKNLVFMKETMESSSARLHLELLRRGPFRHGDALRARAGRPHPWAWRTT